MLNQRLSCEAGHCWELAIASDGVTLDAQPACPICGAAGRPAVEVDTDRGGTAPTLQFEPGGDAASRSSPSRVEVPGYEIVRELGRGGMGVVYLARQLKLGRLVALKMVLAGDHAGERDRTRFLAEASAVARLRHENIVQVFEIGEVAGRPYFSLEFVSGGSLADQLDGTPLPARTAASLILPLARAIQAAHDAGIVHRDLKPANILLSLTRSGSSSDVDSLKSGTIESIPLATRLHEVSPKITDFGLAKSLHSTNGPTQTGAVLGTPSYMAPEQASGDSRRAGPAVDVYALGAILYELITGRPPFRAETPLDTIMLAVSQEPVRPTQLQPKCPRDLETICLKCLQKEPAKRYESANELANDLQRFINGEPIHARPIGLLGRSWRWARRNPLAASLLTTLFVVMTGGLVVTSSLWVKARREHQRSIEQESRAKANLLKAVEAVDQMLTRVVDERLAYVPQFEDERRRILEDAVRFYDDFLKQEADDPLLRREMGRACFRLGKVFQTLGRTQQSLEAFERAAKLQEKLVSDFPNEPEYRNDLAKTLQRQGVTLRLLGRAAQSESYYMRALQLAEELVAAHPQEATFLVTLAECHGQLGYFYFQTNRLDQAEQRYKQAISDWNDLVAAYPSEFNYALERAKAHGALAFYYQNRRMMGPAEEYRRVQIDELESLAKQRPDRIRDIEPELAEARLSLGSILTETGRAAQADETLQQGMIVYRKLVRDFPKMPRYRLTLAQGHQAAAMRGRSAQQPDQAEKALKEAIVLLEELDRNNPEAFYHGMHLRRAYVELGQTYVMQGKFDEAIQMAEKAVANARNDAELARTNSIVQMELTRSLQRLADLLEKAQRNTEAIKVLDEVLARQRATHQLTLQSAETHGVLSVRAVLLARTGDYAAAERELKELPRASRDSSVTYNIACTLAQMARAITADASVDTMTRDRKAAEWLREAFELIKQLATNGYFNSPLRARQLHQDRDLDPLRANAEFRRWFAENFPTPMKTDS